MNKDNTIAEIKEDQFQWNWETVKEFVPYSALSEIFIMLIFSALLISSKFVKSNIKDWQNNLNLLSEQNQQLEKEAIKILTLSRADRVVIGEFSNGETSFSGMSFLKIRLRQEATLSGFKKIKQIIGKNYIDLYDIKEEINLLFREKEISIPDVDQEKNLKEACKYHLYKCNAKAFFEELVYHKDKPIGVISFYFSNPQTIKNFEEIKKSSTYFLCKEEISKTLYPKNSIFSPLLKVFNFVF